MEESTDSVLQYILALSSDALKDVFFHLGGKISELPNLKKHAVAEEIAQAYHGRWSDIFCGGRG